MDFDLDKIKKLEEEYGLPLYVFDEQGFIDNYHELNVAMQRFYPEYRISYSYKTNYTPYVCKTVKSLGGYAEVVSEMEYNIACKIGYEYEKIIFNGPDKGEAGLAAFLNGSIVNVDNLKELTDYIQETEKYPDQHFKIGLRVNLDLGQDFLSRFGMDEEELETAVSRIRNTKNLTLAGLHCHISRCRSRGAWRKRAEIMLKLADRYFSEPPDYIDLGSGMFGSMESEFASQFDDIPSYFDYAEVTAKLFAVHYRNRKKPILFTEPGTTLVSRFFSLIGIVKSIKTIRGKSFAILNCSEHNLGETCILKQLPMKVVGDGALQKEYTNMDFVGYTCLEQDVMYMNYCGPLAIGDYIIFGNIGGYSNVYKPPFIRPNCAMIVEKKEKKYALIKSTESFEDILHTYQF